MRQTGRRTGTPRPELPVSYSLSSFSERYWRGRIGSDIDDWDAEVVLDRIERSLLSLLGGDLETSYSTQGFEVKNNERTVANFEVAGKHRTSYRGIKDALTESEGKFDLLGSLIEEFENPQSRIKGVVHPGGLVEDSTEFDEWRRSVESYLEGTIGPTKSTARYTPSLNGISYRRETLKDFDERA